MLDTDKAAIENRAAGESLVAAQDAGLRYVSDQMPGIRRRRRGKSFSYLGTDGRRIAVADVLDRIKSLGIPPAWTDVWISPLPDGHIQATGRDARGRKQYRYHTRWREVRDGTKYDRILAFGAALPAIRARVQADLGLHGLQRDRVLATVVQLLDATAIRVGNEEYARANNSRGLTTLEQQNVQISGDRLHFSFVGKSGKEHSVDVRDRRVARIVKRLEDLPGQELFQFVDEAGAAHRIESDDVNAYIRQVGGAEFSAKDFRTWHGTVRAAQALRDIGPFETKAEARRNVSEAIKRAARYLGNTPTICRKCYVHPIILAAYLDGSLAEAFASRVDDATIGTGLDADEAIVLRLLTGRTEESMPDAA